jgi:hypothetical protein
MLTSQEQTNAVFEDALVVWNMALARNRGVSPYKELVSGCDRFLEGEEFGVAIYAANPQAPHGIYTIGVRNGLFHIVERGNKEVEVDWKVRENYLQHVSRFREKYLDEPGKLEWGWLVQRLKRLIGDHQQSDML